MLTTRFAHLFCLLPAAAGLLVPLPAPAAPQPAGPPVMIVQSDTARLAVGADGRVRSFTDRYTGEEYAVPGGPFARVRKAGKEYPCASAAFNGHSLTLGFGPAGVTAEVGVTSQGRAFVLEVLSVAGEGVEELTFVEIPLTLKGAPEEPFAGCALALNLKTRVRELPRANSLLRASCYPRFGFVGAAAAIIGCPQAQLRRALQEAVTAAPELPHSPIGGPWALDGKDNRRSYLFNFGDMSEAKVDDWIKLAKQLGVTQIDFHGGNSFRFGDCQPNPATYPRGAESMKAVIDRLHAAGIQAGLHTYAMFIDKRCPWVTPVPDPRLGKDATFTLADALPADAASVPVEESTDKMSAVTGFFVRNSVTLQVDDELITYTGVAKAAPYAFTGCRRGAYGTRPAAHAKGAKVHHLRECFGLFVPDGDSTLFTEVAARTAGLYNDAGFDMIYLDALDGGDSVAGPEVSWHYESKFVYEIWKRLKRPAVMEMSTFHHHLWCVRSRMGAWDHPTRSHKEFIDLHCRANEANRRMFLPGQLGWWSFTTWSGADGEPTLPDDIEYLCAKALGTGDGLSFMGIDPVSAGQIPALPRLAAIVRRYETLRRADYFSGAVKEKLRAPGAEFTLDRDPKEEWQFRPVEYARHKVECLEEWSSAWKVRNRFGRQPAQIRIEALLSAGPYDAPANQTLADFARPEEFAAGRTQPGVAMKLERSEAQVRVGPASGCLAVSSKLAGREGSWCQVTRTFAPPLNLSACRALGFWVYGDGKGEVLNLQLRSPQHLTTAVADHYVLIDFEGWRYVELVEPESRRWAGYQWPYGDPYSIYRESIRHDSIETLSLWVNNVPAVFAGAAPANRASVTTYLSPIRALPAVSATLRNPSVTINGKTITFPVELASGSVLELGAGGACRAYGPKGEDLGEVKPQGEVPALEAGENHVRFACEAPAGVRPRAWVSVISRGEPLRGQNAKEKVDWKLVEELGE